MNNVKKVFASIMAVFTILMSLELGGLMVASAANEKDQIDILEFISEDAEKRHQHIKHLDQYDTENMVVYLNDDGTTTFYLFQSPIRYKDKNGDLQLYDNTLIPIEDTDTFEKGYKYKSKFSDVDILFPEHLLGTEGMKLKKGEYSIQMIPVPLSSDLPEQSPEPTPTPELTPIPEATPTPEATLTPDATVVPTPEATPTPEVTPAPEVTVTPDVTPTPEVANTPETTPESTQAVESKNTPEVTHTTEATPTPEITPEPTPIVEVTSTPETTSTVAPANTPTATPEATPQPEKEKKKETKNDEEKVWEGRKSRTDVDNKYKVKIKEKDKDHKDRIAEYASEESDDIVYRYSAMDRGFKEDIVINRYTGQNSFDFVIIAPNLDINIREDKVIEFIDSKTDKIIFASGDFYAMDSFTGDFIEGEGHYTEDINVSLIASDKDEHRIRIEVSKDYLEDSSTVYPVTIDPTFTISNEVIDTFINSLYPYNNYSTNVSMYVGHGTGSTIRKAYGLIKFDLTNFLNKNIIYSNITSATYNLYNKYTYTSTFYLRPYRLLYPFVSYQVTWKSFWDTQSSWQWNGYQYLINRSGWFSINISDMFKGWVRSEQGFSGGYPYYGFMVRERDDTYDRLRKFGTAQDSSNRPYLTIQYNNETDAPNDATPTVTSTGTANSNACDVKISWNGVEDKPTSVNSGVDYYRVYLKTGDGAYTQVATQDHNNGTGAYSYTVTDKPDNTTYYAKIVSVDNFENQKSVDDVPASSAYSAGDYTAPSAPSSVTVSPSNGTNNNTAPTVTWSNIVKEPLEETIYVQYAINSTADGDFINIGSTADSGSGTVTIPDNGQPDEYDDGDYTIYVRAIDDNGNTGAYSSVVYTLDKTDPVVTLSAPANNATINTLVDITGSVTETNPVTWTLSYGEGATPSSYTTLDSGSGNINSLIHEWNTSALADGTYELKLEATDEAGNTEFETVDVVKSPVSTSTTEQLDLTNPTTSEPIITGNSMTVTYEESQNPSNVLTEGSLYIDGHLIDSDDSDGLSADFFATVHEDYFTEGIHRLYVRAKDTSDSDIIKYTSTSYDATLSDDFSTTPEATLSDTEYDSASDSIKLDDSSGNYALLGEVVSNFTSENLGGKIETVTLTVGETKPVNTAITYDISIDGGQTWPATNVSPGTPVSFDNAGGIVKVRANLSTTDNTVTPELRWWQLEVRHVNLGQEFTIQMVTPPTNVSAMSNVNYKTLIRWEENNTNPNPESLTKYNVYRREGSNDFSDLTAAEVTKVAEGLTEKFFYDYNLNYSKTFYYCVTAVENVGTVESPKWRESLPSNDNASAQIVDKDEHEKRLGLQDYWKYAGFSTGSGTGYIEVSEGNLAYQSTDFVYPGPLLAMVMRRTYNNQATSKSPLGVGFDFSFNTALMKYEITDAGEEEKGVILKDGDGSIHKFVEYDDSGTIKYAAPAGVFMELTHQEADESNPERWFIDRKDGIQYIFDENMKLLQFNERNGNNISFDYNDKGNITTIENNAGDDIVFTYYDENDAGNSSGIWNDLVKTVTDPSGRVFTYKYLADENGDALAAKFESREITIEGNVVYKEEFIYDQSNDNVEGVKDGEGITTTINYDASDRVSDVTWPVDNEANHDEYFMLTYSTLQPQTIVTTKQSKTTTFTYRADGCVVHVEDPSQHVMNYTYNDDRQVTGMSYDNIGQADTISYIYKYDDNTGDLEKITDPCGHTTIFEYLLDIEDPNTYNPFNKPYRVITQVREGVTATTEYGYDDNGNVETIIDPSGKTVSKYYHDGTLAYAGLLKKSTDRFTNETSYSYNSHGWLTDINMPMSVSTSVNAYDSMGNPTEVKDAEGNVTKYEYDLLGRRTKVYLPDDTPTVWTDNNKVSTTYTLSHNVKTIIDARGFVTKYDYDKMGRVRYISKDDGDGDDETFDIWETEYLYDENSNNRIIENKDPNGIVSVQYFDEIGRLEKIDSGGAIVEYDYDDIGNMIRVEDADGRISIAEYDMLNRIELEIIDPNDPDSGYTGENMSTIYTYDYIGNVLSVTDGEGNVTDYAYDILNRLDTVTQNVTMDIDGTTTVVKCITDYDYDFIDDTTGVKYVVNTIEDAEKGIKKTYIDPLGRIHKQTDEGNIDDGEEMTVTHVYNDNGQVTKTTYNDGSDVDYTYYPTGQVKRIEYDDTTNQEDYTDFTYDANGNMTHAIGKREGVSISTVFAYDAHNRVTSRIENNNTIQYQYRDNDQLENIIYPAEPGSTTNLSTLHYDYNADGQLSAVKLNGDTVESYNYTAAGYVDYIMTELDFNTAESDTIKKSYTYNTAGLLEQIKYENQATTNTLEQYDYTYNDNGMILTETSNVYYTGSAVTTAKTHTYDEIGRLRRTDKDSGSTTYTDYHYDKVGNRTKTFDGTDTFVYSYGQFNDLEQVDKNGVKQLSYGYDGVGRTDFETQWENGTTEIFQTRYYYNDVGELGSIQMESAPVDESGYEEEAYSYNYEGQRIKKHNISETVNYYYSGGVQLFTTNGPGYLTTENILTPSGRIIASQRFTDGTNNPEGWYFYNYDMRNSTTAILDDDFTPKKEYTYDEFGNTSDTGTLLNEIAFTGAVSDQNTGLYYMNARYYNSNTGRFLTQDSYKGNPYDPWTQHLYSYCGNNPINMIDPTGHVAKWARTPAMLIDGEQQVRPFHKVLPKSEPDPMEDLPERVRELLRERLGTEYTDELIKKLEAFNKIDVRNGLRDIVRIGGLVYPISAELLKRSFKEDKDIYHPKFSPNRIINNNYFRQEISNMLSTIETEQFSDEIVTLDFSKSDSKDLYYGIGKTDILVSGTLDNDAWKLSVTLCNIYDFDRWRSGGTKGDILNNIGLAGQYYKDVHPYIILMNFEFDFK